MSIASQIGWAFSSPILDLSGFMDSLLHFLENYLFAYHLHQGASLIQDYRHYCLLHHFIYRHQIHHSIIPDYLGTNY